MSEGTTDTTAGLSQPSIAEGAASGRDLLRAFTSISRALNLGQPLPETLDLIAEKVSRTMGHKYCAVLLANEESGELLIEGSFGLSAEYVRALNAELVQRTGGEGPAARSVTAQAYRTGMPVYAPDITADQRFVAWRAAALEAGYKSIVALPLIFRGDVIGVLNCYDEPREYTEDQVEALAVVAEQAASAVGIARLIENQRATIGQLDATNRRVVAQRERLQRSEHAHDTLISLLLENRPLDDITATLSGLLGTAVVLQDEELRVLSRSGAPDDYQGIARGETARQGLAGISSERGEGKHRGTLEVEVSPGRNALVVPLDLGGAGSGYLSAPLEAGVEREFFQRTLEQAATAYALYTIRQRTAQETEDRIKGDLLADLLSDRFRDSPHLHERGVRLGLDFHRGPFRIFAVRCGSLADHVKVRLLYLAKSFVGDDPGAAGVEGDHLTLLLSRWQAESPHRTGTRLLNTIRQEFPNLDVSVGVSAWCTRLENLATCYRETRTLLDLAESLGMQNRTICYDDWQAYGLLLYGADKGAAVDFAHRTLRPLLAQDRTSQDVLLSTIRAYLNNKLSPTRTAESLHVHPNTVKYRLKRASELLDLDLGDLDALLTVRIALMIAGLRPDALNDAPGAETDHGPDR